MPEQRFLIYRPIHKALRHTLFSTSRQIGLTDFGDEAVTQETLGALGRTIAFLREHREHEDAHVHPALERRAPGITAKFVEDHEEDERLTAEIEQLAAQIRDSHSDQRVALGIQVHERFNAYVGIYLGHLYREETELQQAIWDHFTNDEMLAMHQAIIQSIPPERMGDWLAVMCSSFSPDEITPILMEIKAVAPPEVFQGMSQLAEQAMPSAIWEKVRARIS